MRIVGRIVTTLRAAVLSMRWLLLLTLLVALHSVLSYCATSVLSPTRSKRLRARDNAKGFLTFADIGNYGRLGNQLFQVASTIGIAEHNSMSWAFPEHIENTTVGELFGITGRRLDSLINFEYTEKDQLYYDISLSPPPGKAVSIKGYFQSPRYFQYSSASLRSVFKIQSHIQREVTKRVPEVRLRNSVTLHVRRGDYKKLNHMYNLLEPEYYINALTRLKAIDVVIIVSDDIRWCQNNLGPRIRHRVVYSPFSEQKYDFTLLYLGKHSILANSSFSWWSAYLKYLLKPKALRGKVFAPRPWYNVSGQYANLNVKEFYPMDWVVLDILSP